MWRAVVLATGISLGILGAEFMVVDRLVIADASTATLRANNSGSPTLSTYGASYSPRRQVFVPPEWAPWGLLSAGVLLGLYGASLKAGDAG
jgi:hypothetical protein